MRVFPPNIATNDRSWYNNKFPKPYWKEDNPVAPLYGVVKSKCKQEGKNQETTKHKELAAKYKKKILDIKNMESTF